MARVRNFLTPCLDVRMMWLVADGLHRSYLIATTCALALAAAMGLGQATRFSGTGFATVNATGGHGAWSVLFLVLALAMLMVPSRSRIATMWVLRLAAVVYALFAIGFGIAAVLSPLTPFTGPAAYGTLALWHVSQAESYRAGKP